MTSFFSDLGKSLSNAGQETIKKTKEFTAITKKRNEIREAESELEDIYTEIGKKYYSLFKENVDERFRELFISASKAKENIEVLNEELKLLKGIKICSNCGAEQQGNTKYCSKCGNKMP